jgi:hypothetical protein
MNSSFSGGGTTDYKLFIFFPKFHFNRFFLSLHFVLSLCFLLKHETGLGFGLLLETPAWWWLTAWWLIGLAISAWWWLGLAILVWWWLGLASQHEMGLGFGLRLETPAWWWWLTA